MPPPAGSGRRDDLDALRGFAMLLGIVLHASLAYFPFPWSVQDSQQSKVFSLVYAVIHGFRMPLFFLLSGFFTMLVLERRGPRIVRPMALPNHARRHFRADGGLVRLVPRFLAPDQLLPERLPSPWSGVFLPSARRLSEFRRLGLWFDLAPGRTQRLRMSITGSSSGDT